jgi:hypothetical protein
MNKLTKVGYSALCGSLAAISAAHAGDLTVTGGADMTWISKADAVTGTPLGIGSNFTMKGSGELDNGWTFDLAIAHTNAGAYSYASINLGMGGWGKLNFNQGDSANGIKAFDDKMPTAWEETWGAGMSTGVRNICGSCLSQNIMYTTPTLVGTTLTFTYAPDYSSSDVADKTTASAVSESGRSYDATININPSLGTEILAGLNIFAGGAVVESHAYSSLEEDQYDAVAGVTYDLGPLSVGYQVTGEFLGEESAEDYNAYKNTAYGVAFNVNDDLSISYGKWKARKAAYNNSAVPNGYNDRNLEVSSLQVAYTMGGASFRLAEVSADNAEWTAGANKKATIVSLGLAF